MGLRLSSFALSVARWNVLQFSKSGVCNFYGTLVLSLPEALFEDKTVQKHPWIK